MCLNSITRKVTLKRDKTVYKAVKLRCDGDEISMFFGYNYSEKGIIRAFGEDIYTFLGAKKYKAGFHCYRKSHETKLWIDRDDEKTFPYIIPAGTKVLYGKQKGFTVIVTPVLINPRMTEK